MTGAQPPQSIKFCRAPDGVRIAYAVHGSGPPLLVSTCWLSQLQYDWASPVWQHFAPILKRVKLGEGGNDLAAHVFSYDLMIQHCPSQHPMMFAC